MWLETYKLLERELGDPRRARWKRAIEKNIAIYAPQAAERLDFPWYNSPYISTSPNHYSLWAANLLFAAHVFGGHKDWEDLGTRLLHRFAAVEQTPDGFWGEHARSGPAIGYNHLTLSAVALYWELTKHPQTRWRLCGAPPTSTKTSPGPMARPSRSSITGTGTGRSPRGRSSHTRIFPTAAATRSS
jgi:hypothetical protein